MLLCNSGGHDFRAKSQLLSPSAPLIPLHGAVLSPKNDFVLNYTLSNGRDKVGSRLPLTSCSVVQCLKKVRGKNHTQGSAINGWGDFWKTS